jgi:predicted CoA-binding protein
VILSTRDPAFEFIQQRTLAVVGVSRNPAKYGHRVWRDLRARGYTVYGVNPHLESLEGERIYPALSALPETPGGVVIVTPPPVTEKIVAEAAAAGIRRVWMQPGAESEAAIESARRAGLDIIAHACIMMTG